MFARVAGGFLIVFTLTITQAFAQLTITFPTTRAVFQRNNSNQTTLYMAGTFDICLDRIEARLTPRVAGQGTALNWTTLQTNPVGGQFYGSVVAFGGWYDLEIRGIRNESVVATHSVERIGIGEVFVIAGQSNATGGGDLPNGPGAADDRVSSINFQNINLETNTVIPYPQAQLPCPEFVHLDANVKTAPFGNYAWCWGAFGDLVAARLNVPVLIFNAGWSGTSLFNWRESIPTNGQTNSNFGFPFPTGLPFGHLRLALNNYVAQQGYRAVLWHQGELDNFYETSRESYRSDLRQIIEASRSLSGKPNLAWMVARVSRMTKNGVSRLWQPVIDAQNDVIGNNGNDPALVLPQVFSGPETDVLEGPAFRQADNIHFTGSGLISLAQAWDGSITESFLSSSSPYLPTAPPQVAVACGPATNQLTFQAPGGWVAQQWLPQNDCHQVLDQNQSWAASTGVYRLKVRDNFDNVVLSPLLKVPSQTNADVSAYGNTTVSQGGTLTILSSSATACSYSWTGPAGFASTNPTVFISNTQSSQAGTYTVSVTNPYGCQAVSSVLVSVVSTLESASSGNWNEPSTWTCNCLPNASTCVKINAGHSITINGATVQAKSVTLEAGNLIFENGGVLSTNN
ncbi:sialate O-acetylesterase [Arundinibacter roseus]|uniref:Sialate O-acetylesterase domain-containing protein n=1 Tax=Arundinibacter roseus TaxID=2070510 RepID=A0A4R4KFT4_9BACT|nr:sialate O-acetylesterase [Arundinibacter roseus]TDB66864.1 hypothetical protein EZE20_06990 [Arundinibacter roseus]